jgi:DNA primase
VRQAVDAAAPFLDWLLLDLDAADATPEARGEVINAILSILESVPDRVLRYEFVRKVSEKAGIPADVLWKRGTAVRAAAGEGTKEAPESFSRVPPPAVERRLLSAFLNGGEDAAPALRSLDPDSLSDSRLRSIFLALRAEKKDDQPLDFSVLATHLASEDERALLSELACDETSPGGSEAISSYINQLTRKHLERRAATVQQEIVAAETRGDKEEIDRLSRSMTALAQQIHDLGRDGARRKNC